jgi:formate-dependent nitrite reductase membrane component NrfD
MNVFVADPRWHWEIVTYFFLGGIAAGAYLTATLVDLVTAERERPLTRLGYFLALPLVMICGLLLTIDLGHPERFYHMLFKSEVVKHALSAGWPASGEGWKLMAGGLIFKPWSPMSIGSWGLSVFGFCATLSAVGALWPGTRLGRWLNEGFLARLLQAVGCLSGFFLAAYTGALLSATNQPVWSDTTWVASLFLASGASTGMAALLLLSRWANVPEYMVAQLERADVLSIVIELLVFAGFLVSLGTWLGPVWGTRHGKLLIAGTLLLAILLPLAMHLGARASRAGWLVPAASVCVLAGGLLMRYAMLHTPADLLAEGPAVLAGRPEPPVGTPAPFLSGEVRVSPEDGRPHNRPGADPLNRPVTVRSKPFLAVLEGEPPPEAPADVGERTAK